VRQLRFYNDQCSNHFFSDDKRKACQWHWQYHRTATHCTASSNSGGCYQPFVSITLSITGWDEPKDMTGQDKTGHLPPQRCHLRMHHIHCRRAQVLHPEAHPQGSTAACYDFVVIFIITIVSVLLVIFIC
jgi:hypothetical protein